MTPSDATFSPANTWWALTILYTSKMVLSEIITRTTDIPIINNSPSMSHQIDYILHVGLMGLYLPGYDHCVFSIWGGTCSLCVLCGCFPISCLIRWKIHFSPVLCPSYFRFCGSLSETNTKHSEVLSVCVKTFLGSLFSCCISPNSQQTS